MDHELAERTGAADHYLLNEFSAEERAEFEAHFFDCSVCSATIREGSIFIDSVKQIAAHEKTDRARAEPFRARKRFDWFAWMRPSALAPSLAALGLTAIVGYQNLVTLPALRMPQLLSTNVIAPLAREEAPVIPVDPRLPRFNLNFMVDAARANSNYVCEFTNASGAEILTIDSGPRDASAFTLSFLLSPSQFPPGRYALTVRDRSDRTLVVQRYNFVIRIGEHK